MSNEPFLYSQSLCEETLTEEQLRLIEVRDHLEKSKNDPATPSWYMQTIQVSLGYCNDRIAQITRILNDGEEPTQQVGLYS